MISVVKNVYYPHAQRGDKLGTLCARNDPRAGQHTLPRGAWEP